MKKGGFKKILRKIINRIILFFLLLIAFTVLQVLALKYINPPFTPNTAWEWAESIIKEDPSKKPVYIWKDLKMISPHLRRAVIAAEDQRFLMHHGFDYNEIQNALKRFIRYKKLRGASTISMQTARSVFLLSSRSIFRKTAEIYYTIVIELLWSKERIFEMYLNTVDWGTSVTGAEAAAQKYYAIPSQHLTAAQAALMTAILPSPHRWSVRKPTPYLKKRQRQIMADMHKMPLVR